MKLRVVGDIVFQDIRHTVPLCIVEDFSREFLFFVKETRDIARRTIAFASIYDHPEYSQNSPMSAIDAICMPHDQLPCVLIFVRPEVCTETIALHEVMHAYLHFAEGFDLPRQFDPALAGDVNFLASLSLNIAMDMHTNERLRQRGFAIDSLRESYFQGLAEILTRFSRPSYVANVAIQWQAGAMWGHMLAGAHFYQPTQENLRVHRQLDALCRKRSPGTIRFRDLLVTTFRETGYDTPAKVGRFVDEVTPKLFAALGEPFRPELLRHTRYGRVNSTETAGRLLMPTS